ncbi:MAG: methyltransferase, TIGR04325 family [Mobilitalea sp.]
MMNHLNKVNDLDKKFNIWEGIYRSFEEAEPDAIGLGFNGDIYCNRAFNVAKECFDALKSSKSIPCSYKQLNTPLPAIVAMMTRSKEKLRILDFGGGLGIGYMVLAESIACHNECIDYTIIEVPQVCEVGRKLFSEDKNIIYLESLPSSASFGFIYLSSVLQYIEYWQDFLKSLSKYKASYILLSDICAGSIPTFVTL